MSDVWNYFVFCTSLFEVVVVNFISGDLPQLELSWRLALESFLMLRFLSLASCSRLA